ncbi:MAG: DUF1987 domain-containing protein [Bacteroidales bacterium]|jgi:hypothetical protein|nr:DUF1987 domain-containing protein [Bacteroidales bacterium]
MEALRIEPTDDSPLINFNPFKGLMIITGNSIPENASLFYEPVILWLNEYNKNPQLKTTFFFKLKVISSSSTKIFFDILNSIDALYDSGKSAVNVLWHYSLYDDEIREIGLDYRDSMNAPFELILSDANDES